MTDSIHIDKCSQCRQTHGLMRFEGKFLCVLHFEKVMSERENEFKNKIARGETVKTVKRGG